MGNEPVGEVSIVFDDGLTVVRLSGEVNIALIRSLDVATHDAIGRGSPIRVDMSDLTFLDSIGTAFLSRLLAAEAEHGRRLSVTGASTYISQALQLSGLADLIAFQAVPEP